MKKDFSNFTLILAFQRSGTTALRSILEATGKFLNFGEIFAPQRTKEKHGVYNFFESEVKNDPKLVYPLFETRVKFFDSYFESLLSESISAKKSPLIDVKYDVLYNLHTYFQADDIEPFFLKYCKMRNVKIVHLIRENSFEIALSLAIARENKQYHYTSNEKPKSELKLNKEKVESFYKNHIKQKDAAIKFLKNYSHLEVKYESSFVKNKLSNNTLDSLSNYLGLELENIESTYVKKTKSNKELIVNFEEIHQHIFEEK